MQVGSFQSVPKVNDTQMDGCNEWILFVSSINSWQIYSLLMIAKLAECLRFH